MSSICAHGARFKDAHVYYINLQHMFIVKGHTSKSPYVGHRHENFCIVSYGTERQRTPKGIYYDTENKTTEHDYAVTPPPPHLLNEMLRAL